MTDDGQTANATAGPTERALRPGSARGFVPPGGSISTGTSPTASNNTVATFSLPDNGPGTEITLRSETDETGAFCAGQPCSGKLLYLSPFTGYTNTRYPAKLKIVWDKTVAGRGVELGSLRAEGDRGPGRQGRGLPRHEHPPRRPAPVRPRAHPAWQR